MSKQDNNGHAVTSTILRNLGRGPKTEAPLQVPKVAPRLRIEDDDFIVDDFDEFDEIDMPVRRRGNRWTDGFTKEFATHIATLVLGMLRAEFAGLVEQAANIVDENRIFCPICSHDDCKHFHQVGDYSVADLVEYLGVEKSTVYTWLYHQRITRPVSENPHLWDPHVIGCFKHDKKLVFSTPQYDQAEHQDLLVKGRAEHEKKRKVKSAKLSAHMVRENARRRATKRRSQPTPKSTHTRTPRSRKR